MSFENISEHLPQFKFLIYMLPYKLKSIRSFLICSFEQ